MRMRGRPTVVVDEGYIRKRIKIDPLSGCWLWTAGIHHTGYGQIKGQSAHRMSYTIFKGAPAGLVCHIRDCPNKHCVNPEHLYDGDFKSNASDLTASITHCPHGHIYDNTNTYINSHGTRECRICRREMTREIQQERYFSNEESFEDWMNERVAIRLKAKHRLLPQS